MHDVSAGHVTMQHLQAENGKLIGYMVPTPAQRNKLQYNCLLIARLALKMHSLSVKESHE